MDQLFRAEFDDTKILESLDKIEKGILEVGDAATQADKEIEKAFNPDFALGVGDGIKDLKRQYLELKEVAQTLRTALRNATNPDAIDLYKKALNDAQRGMKSLETTGKQAGINLRELNKDAGLGKQVFNEFFGAFTKATLIATAIQKVIEFTKFATKLSEETKLATKQFTAFLGSADLAAGVVADLTAFAGKKLLNTDEVFSAGKALLAFGEDTEDLTKVLGRIADISAATGKNFGELATIYGKARTAGVLYAEDINQLVDAGVPIVKEFAKQMGVSTDQVKKLASEGKIGFEELQLAFFNLTKEGAIFAGQAEAQAETLSGVWQNLFNEVRPAIAAIGEFFSDIGKGIGFILTDLVTGIKDLFGIAAAEQGAFFDISKEQTKKALTEEEIERKKLEEAAEKRRKELAAKSNADRQKEIEKRKKDFEALLKDVQLQVERMEVENTFNPIAKVEKAFALALSGVEDLQKRLLALASTPAQRQQIQEAISRLFGEVVAKYNEELDKALIEISERRNELNDLLVKDLLPQAGTIDDDLAFRAQGIIKSLQLAAQEAIDEQEPRTLAEMLGISDEGLEGLKDATAQIIDSLQQIGEARLQEAEAATRAAEQKVQAAEDALAREQELAADGLANNTDLRKKELEEAKKQRDAALKEEAKARRSQILLDSAGQVSALITSAANIFKSLSAIPFAGIPLAIATIGIMLGAFAKAKVDALKAASVPKLRKGVKIKGRTHEGGGELAMSDSGDFYELERDEWVIGTAHSREHDGFLERLNKGEYKGVNLEALARGRSDYQNPLSAAVPRLRDMETARQKVEETAHFAALVKAYESGASKIVQAIEGKEVVMPWKAGYKVRSKKGNTTTIQTVLPE